VTITVVAARTPFAPTKLFELRMLGNFHVSMRWVVSNIIEPRVMILELTDTRACPHRGSHRPSRYAPVFMYICFQYSRRWLR
jgi:hypothetical protein